MGGLECYWEVDIKGYSCIMEGHEILMRKEKVNG